MATVSGFLRFDRDRTAISSSSLAGIANVAIVLQNTDTNKFLAVNTNPDGSYVFTNVPDGNYRIVEAYGTAALPSPGDFSGAAEGSQVQAAFPPISYASNPPPGATNLDAVTPTTVDISVKGTDLSSQDILNGSVIYSPIQTIMDTGVIIEPENLITEASNGDFGNFPQGKEANSGVDPNPYPDMGSGFAYTQPSPIGVNPGGGQYTIQNTMNDATAAVQNTWWRVSDHTTGNETGRMMVVNGDNPGKIIFEQKVSVKPDTYYLMSSWILNLSKSSALVDPQLGVQVLDANGQIIYEATLGTLIPMNPNAPEWKQIGTVINSQSNDSLTIRFRSMGPEVVGNDYAIDDIALNEVQITAYRPVKSADKSVARVGDIVTYTVTLTNTGINPLINPSVKDMIPAGMSFIPGTVTVNGLSKADADPDRGIAAPDVNAGEMLSVTFQARADTVTDPNPTVNAATAAYSYTPVSGGIPIAYNKRSNDVYVNILPPSADLEMNKSADRNSAVEGGQVIYKLTVKNNGPSAAWDYKISDTLPNGLFSPEYSLDGGATWQPWSGGIIQMNLAAGDSTSLLIRANVMTDSPWSDLTNIATVSSTTPDPNIGNNSDGATLPVRSEADLSIRKTSDSSSVNAGDLLTYTLSLMNNGPNSAKNVRIDDQTAAELTRPEYSLDGGKTWQPWSGRIDIGSLAANASYTVLIRAAVDNSATGDVVNTAAISSSTFDPVTENNSSTVKIPVTTSADLELSKTPDRNPVSAGSVITYTLGLKNKGPNPAREIILRDKIPSELTEPEYSLDGGATWKPWEDAITLDALAVNESLNILLRAKVIDDGNVSVTNQAGVGSKTPDPDTGNNTPVITTPISSVADVAITKTADKASAHPGEVITYTIKSVNNGPNAAVDIKISDQMPAELLNVEYSGDGGKTWQPWGGSLALTRLLPNYAYDFMLRGTVGDSAGESVTNTALITTATAETNTENNRGSVTTPIILTPPIADISVVKTVNPPLLLSGKTATFKLVVENLGPGKAENVVLKDKIAKVIRNPLYSEDGGETWEAWDGTLSLGDMAAGERMTVLIKGTVASNSAGYLMNSASVQSSTEDPEMENNISTATLVIGRRDCCCCCKR